jgi:hypothetical protein
MGSIKKIMLGLPLYWRGTDGEAVEMPSAIAEQTIKARFLPPKG